MTLEQRCAFLVAQAAVLNARVAGMHAENMMRVHRGENIAYAEEAFEKEISSSVCNWNSAIDYLRG